ncbi:MAG: peptide chain release factor N(5)-glutamine methyltransferase [Alphaproteobacteria bacterium]
MPSPRLEAIAAPLEGGQATVAAVLAEAAARLGAAAVPEPRRDARLLLAQALGLSREALLAVPERGLDQAAAAAFAALVARRAAREPVSRILGRREFWSLEFRVTPDTLDPRPDSETVVAAALERLPGPRRGLEILDLGTGCGALLLALLTELPGARGLGVDRSEGAARVARENAIALGLAGRARFVVGDWGAALAGRFNLVVTNPPYVREADIATLGPEVAGYEPRDALAGGADGLAAYRALAPGLTRLLSAGGIAAIEIGAGREAEVAALMRGAGLALESAHRDLAGMVRCLVVRPE